MRKPTHVNKATARRVKVTTLQKRLGNMADHWLHNAGISLPDAIRENLHMDLAGAVEAAVHDFEAWRKERPAPDSDPATDDEFRARQAVRDLTQ